MFKKIFLIIISIASYSRAEIVCSGVTTNVPKSIDPFYSYAIICSDGQYFNSSAFLSWEKAVYKAETKMKMIFPNLSKVTYDFGVLYKETPLDESKSRCVISRSEEGTMQSFKCNFQLSELNRLRVKAFEYNKVIEDLYRDGFKVTLDSTAFYFSKYQSRKVIFLEK